MSAKEYRKKLMDAELSAILGQFEALANSFIEGERNSPYGIDEHGTIIPMRDGNMCAGEIQALIASVKKERGLL